ncbi:unnamed protein product [Amoebophrya sp. A120]|nr:unnamed protein product [Amoebophrya sp. A120]|eukprot:GSA120T00007498001.1
MASSKPPELPPKERINQLREEGNAEFKSKDYESAVAKYSKAILEIQQLSNLDIGFVSSGIASPEQLEQQLVKLLSNRAQCYSNLNEWAKTEQDCRQILQELNDPNHQKALFQLQKALKKQKQNDEALEICTKLRNLNATSEEIRVAFNEAKRLCKRTADDYEVIQEVGTGNYTSIFIAEDLKLKKEIQKRQLQLESVQEEEEEERNATALSSAAPAAAQQDQDRAVDEKIFLQQNSNTEKVDHVSFLAGRVPNQDEKQLEPKQKTYHFQQYYETKVALKIADRAKLQHMKKTHELRREKDILYRCSHENIIKIKEYFQDEMQVYMVLEYCGGDLFEMCKKTGLAVNSAKFYLAQVLCGLSYLHSKEILHRDLKAENILVNHLTGLVKLIDFGTAKDHRNPDLDKIVETGPMRRTFANYVGTPQFMSPECIKNKFTDYKSEVWSFGCLVFQVLYGLPPFQAGSEYLVILRVMNKDLEFPSEMLYPEGNDLVRQCVKFENEQRLSLSQVKEHAFFKTSCQGRVAGRGGISIRNTSTTGAPVAEEEEEEASFFAAANLPNTDEDAVEYLQKKEQQKDKMQIDTIMEVDTSPHDKDENVVSARPASVETVPALEPHTTFSFFQRNFGPAHHLQNRPILPLTWFCLRKCSETSSTASDKRCAKLRNELLPKWKKQLSKLKPPPERGVTEDDMNIDETTCSSNLVSDEIHSLENLIERVESFLKIDAWERETRPGQGPNAKLQAFLDADAAISEDEEEENDSSNSSNSNSAALMNNEENDNELSVADQQKPTSLLPETTPVNEEDSAGIPKLKHTPPQGFVKQTEKELQQTPNFGMLVDNSNSSTTTSVAAHEVLEASSLLSTQKVHRLESDGTCGEVAVGGCLNNNTSTVTTTTSYSSEQSSNGGGVKKMNVDDVVDDPEDDDMEVEVEVLT